MSTSTPPPTSPPAKPSPRAEARSLEALRQEIDALDDTLHDLIMRRADAVGAIAEAKRGGLPFVPFPQAFRPAREAQILRRLVQRHRGGLPAATIVRVWREIISAKLMLQSPFAVVVHGGETPLAVWDLARAQFGQATPMTLVQTAQQVLHDCAQNTNVLGVLPWPLGEDGDPQVAWWSQMRLADAPRVVQCLPALATPDVTPALVIGRVPFDPSGEDASLALIEVSGDVSRGRLVSLLKQAKLPAQIVAAYNETAQKAPTLFLVRVEGYVISADPRLSDLVRQAGGAIGAIEMAGGFPVPIVKRPPEGGAP